MGDAEYDSVFYQGKGKSKGKRRSTGKSSGRRKNPIGSDGEIMTCGICGADDHFRAVCPRNPGGPSASSGSAGGFGGLTQIVPPTQSEGPLGDLLNAAAPPAVNVAAGMYAAMPVTEDMVWENPDVPWGTAPTFPHVAPVSQQATANIRAPWNAATFEMYRGPEPPPVFEDPAAPQGPPTDQARLSQNR